MAVDPTGPLLPFFLLAAFPGSQSLPLPRHDWEKCFVDSDYEELVKLAKNGLKGECSKKVVIVGAGIGGLTAAKLLKDAGCQITILEASNRVGGRILTHREDDWYAELGAMRLPRDHRIVHEFIHQYKLPLSPFYGSNDNTWYLVNNVRARHIDVEQDPDVLEYPVLPSEKGKSATALYNQTLDTVTTDCRALKEKYDSFTIKEYLIKEGKLSRGAVNMIGDLMNLDGGFHVSFLYSLMDHVAFQQGLDEITGGFDKLPEAFYRSLKRDIRFQAPVVRIIQDGDGVRVFYHKPHAPLPLSETADYVLVATAAKAVRLIKFSPPLSPSKTRALRSVHFSKDVKIFLACRKRFWELDGIFGGKSVTGHPARNIYYPSHNFSSGVGVVLASYTVDDDADFFNSLSDEMCADLVREDLAKIHQLPKSYVQKVCDKHVVKKWGQDKYSMGAYVSLTPYQFTDFAAALHQNEGRVYFAGEYTAQQHGWIDTAMKAGLRAARDIHQAVGTSPSWSQSERKGNELL
ncbi:L-amino-acid oxidase-like isoform X2 [Pelodiscus sinensis]|uniref:L-amino-acid oxidase-like isoform X2 n=1 Tax=Pelodiscus sinensis TaxID=13735 RepID=UPI003F6C2F1E